MDCRTAVYGGPVQLPSPAQCHQWHLVAAASSHDARWALAQQVQQDCRPWGRTCAAQRAGLR
jgi:hypothetical protein